ncbi:transcriptional regulator, LysR family protein [Thioploca ingrica]|uniref:Transcriptional regulator, LysR family protein n=1 Tax=Thioploca ingrica TaxID=40754 RepID=A0A090ADP4_9GAMM|nr:transcriptional regulator, LysR family protein [Thioploca ingrica]
MDIDLLKTFLEVERTRHFGRAANNLYLTQSAVSARIRLLEETLGVALFTRHRNNIQLTKKGERLVKHARAILSAWEQACQDLALDDEVQHTLLRVGGIFSLWEVILQDWIHTLYQHISPLTIQTEVENLEWLLRKLSAGVLDISFLFDPPPVLEIITREVSQVKLLLVSSQPRLSVEQALSENYVLVDWGTRFATFHAQLFPHSPPPIARMALGSLALAFIRHRSGSSYLPQRMCQTLLDQEQLFLVAEAPILDHKVYALYTPQNIQLNLIENVLSYFKPIMESYSVQSLYLEQ